MKKIIRNNIKVLVAVIITAILFGGIGVYAAATYLARDIKFNSTNDNFKATNVEDALNELYDKSDVENCVYGLFEHEANTQINIDFGIVPSKFLLSFNHGIDINYTFYDKSVSQTILDYAINGKNLVDMGYTLNGSVLTSNITSIYNSYSKDYTINYMACK